MNIDFWNNFDIRLNTPSTLLKTACAISPSEYTIKSELSFYNICELDIDIHDDFYFNDIQQCDRIFNLLQRMLKNKWFECIIVGEPFPWVIEGQHRIRALIMNRIETVPAQCIVAAHAVRPEFRTSQLSLNH